MCVVGGWGRFPVTGFGSWTFGHSDQWDAGIGEERCSGLIKLSECCCYIHSYILFINGLIILITYFKSVSIYDIYAMSVER